MPKAKAVEFSTEPGRVICKDGAPYLLIAVPSAFFPSAPSATQEEAEAITARIAFLLTRYGECE